MKFEVTVLGSGSAVPTRTRNPTAHVINIQESYMLADCGEGTQLQLKNSSVKLQRIESIFITHMHGDHFYGLPGLISTLHLLGRKQPLTIYGPSTLPEVIMPMVDIARSSLRYQLNFVSTQNKELQKIVDHKKYEVYSFPLIHKVPTTGFLFKEKEKMKTYKSNIGQSYNIPTYWIPRIKMGEDYVGEDGTVVANHLLTKPAPKAKSYAFCTDTAYNPKLAEYIKEPDLLYHESSFLEDSAKRAKETLHSTASDAAKIAELVGAKKLLLGHFSARYRSSEAFATEAEQIFKNVELAKDGLQIKV